MNIIDASNLIAGTINSFVNINKDSDGLDAIIYAVLIFFKKLDFDLVANFIKHHRKQLIPKIIYSNSTTQSEFSINLFYGK